MISDDCGQDRHSSEPSIKHLLSSSAGELDTIQSKKSPRERRYLVRQQQQGSGNNPFLAAAASPRGMPRYHTKTKAQIGQLKRSFSLVPERMDGVSSDPFIGSASLVNCEYLLQGITLMLIVLTLPFSLVICLKVIAQYQRAVLFRLGRLLSKGALGPGLIFILPCLDTIKRVDLRTFTFDVPTQEVLTKDSVTVAVDAVVYYRIFDPVMSVVNVEDANRSTRLLAQTTLRNVLGTGDLSTLLTDQENMAAVMQETLDLATDTWGVKVERVEIKHVRLPTQLQRAMAAEAEATREAKAKVIAAHGEQLASKGLRSAAIEISACPIALQLRYLQTLNNISAEKNSTIIFPLPIDILSQYFRPRDSRCGDYSQDSHNNQVTSSHEKASCPTAAPSDSPTGSFASPFHESSAYPMPPLPTSDTLSTSYLWSDPLPSIVPPELVTSLSSLPEEASDGMEEVLQSPLPATILVKPSSVRSHGRRLRKMITSVDCDAPPHHSLSLSVADESDIAA